jgi:CDP-diacylglycerol pyrophosphatase
MCRISQCIRQQCFGMRRIEKSRPGRSQDQLHIHIDCLRRRYVQLLRQHGAGLSAEKWTRLTSALHGRYYWAMLIDSSDRAETNIFRTAATLLRVSPGRMEDLTRDFDPAARQRLLFRRGSVHARRDGQRARRASAGSCVRELERQRSRHRLSRSGAIDTRN